MSERVASPTILVVFGATGDLMARKIVPSIFHLHGRGLLPERFRVVGFARRDWTDDQMRDHVRGILAERYPDADGATVEAFLALFVIQRGTFDDEGAYEALRAANAGVDAGWGACANKLFYLAVPPENYETIFRHLAASGLTRECSDELGWTRVLVEKPFGRDIVTSNALDELLGSLFREEQIYRIDHYLAKEMLEGIIAFRFHNDLFEGEWDRRAIDRIDITLDETLGVESRGAFYDGVGALRDVGQNHLLQMLALVAMDKPAALDAESIRAARAAVLEELRPLRRDEIARRSFRAQYEGYRGIKGVSADSETETYFKFEAVMAGPRWAGVPVTFESGKRVGTAPLKRIVVSFRHPRPCLCPEGAVHYRNKVVFTLEPNDSITISFWAKKPGFDEVMEERTFDFFLYRKTEKLQYVEEYSRLLFDAIRGDQTAFVSTDEVRAMWDFTDPIVQAWRDGAVPLASYAPDSDEVRARADDALAANTTKPQVGITGLGRMGAAIARNLLDHGWEVVGHNRHPERARAMAGEGLIPAETLRDLVEALRPPRAVWLMVPAGAAVDATLFGDGEKEGLADLLEAGDVVIDGGNSHFADAPVRAARLAERGIAFLDCGTSGGPGGARSGACLMIGGDREVFRRLEPLFADIAVHDGYARLGGVGSGHFVKMVHNGIEYGMMQSIAEGFAIMRGSDRGLDLAAVADLYQHGSVVESRLVGWLESAYRRVGDGLEEFTGSVGRTGEGEWTVRAAEELGIPTPAIADALRFRVDSESEPSYAGRVLQALRNEFGGHGLGPAKPTE
jgi:glucose-6-phosphate 1-dehydrogenase